MSLDGLGSSHLCLEASGPPGMIAAIELAPEAAINASALALGISRK